MDKFKYKTIRIPFTDGRYDEVLEKAGELWQNPLEIEQFLDKHGDDGWELCAVIKNYVYVFKKRKE